MAHFQRKCCYDLLRFPHKILISLQVLRTLMKFPISGVQSSNSSHPEHLHQCMQDLRELHFDFVFVFSFVTNVVTFNFCSFPLLSWTVLVVWFPRHLLTSGLLVLALQWRWKSCLHAYRNLIRSSRSSSSSWRRGWEIGMSLCANICSRQLCWPSVNTEMYEKFSARTLQ